MKNIFKIFLLATLVFTIGCENEDDPRFQDTPEFGWIEFAAAETTIAVTPRSTSFLVPIYFTAPINLSDVTASYSVNVVSGGNPADYMTGLGTSVLIAANTNAYNLELTFLPGAVSALIANGDSEIDLVLTSATGNVATAPDGAVTTHRLNILCGGEPSPGIYTVDMHDSFGDGWQTNDGNGGDAMVATITDLDGNETTVEIGMCSPYTGSNLGLFTDESLGRCTGPASTSFFDATMTFEVPVGSTGLSFDWPGDQYGEISFEIYNPDGSLLYAVTPGLAAVELPVSFCQ